MDSIESDFIEKQKAICKKYGAKYLEAPFSNLIGGALEGIDKFDMPINGLRHPIESGRSANWYIWAGEYSDAADFFKPVHIYHLLQVCPKAMNYLGLARGWRFLFDNKSEDIWYDENLLNI